MEDLLDDVWDSDTTHNHDGLSLDIKKLRENHNKRGYLDGVTKAKDAKLQEGFDEGFPIGAKLGLQVGKLVGILHALALKYGDEDEELIENLEAAQRELSIQKVLTKSMFDDELNPLKKHEIIKKWTDIIKIHCAKYSIDTDF